MSRSPPRHSRRWKREQQKADLLRHHGFHHTAHSIYGGSLASSATAAAAAAAAAAGGAPPPPPLGLGTTAQATANYMASLNKSAQAATSGHYAQPPSPAAAPWPPHKDSQNVYAVSELPLTSQSPVYIRYTYCTYSILNSTWHSCVGI